ncbi:9250_t:CDS:2, partial [Funneliformis mosseae]
MLLSLNCLIQETNICFMINVGDIYINDDSLEVPFKDFTISNFKEQLFYKQSVKNVVKGPDNMDLLKVEFDLKSLKYKIKDEIINVGMIMDPWLLFAKYFNESDKKPERDHLHIIIVVPITVQDISSQILNKLQKRPKMMLLNVKSLKGLIDKELPEEIKLPLTQYEFDILISNDISDICSSNDLNNNSQNISLSNEQPDYNLILNHIYPFREEEKLSRNNEDLKFELERKLVWTYDPALYILGYYTNGVKAGTYLSSVKDNQFKLNYQVRWSSNVEMFDKYIRKTYISPNVHDHVERLVNVYEKLIHKGIPNVDHLDYINKEKGVIYLSPKGMSVRLKDQQKLFEAITCVLEILIVNALDELLKWIIIDWEDVIRYSNNLANHLTTEEHIPE